MSKQRSTGGTPATLALTAAKIDFTLYPYEHDPTSTAFGDEAAAALGIDPARIFKTLVVQSEAGALAVAVVPVAHRLDPKAMAQALGVKKIQLADPATAARSSGYVVGGISPIGQRRALPTVIDASATDFATIMVSAGRRGLQVELAPADLVRVVDGSLARIATP